MNVPYTKPFLTKLEDLFAESDYHLRYEKGNFKSGYCVLKDKKVAIVNKYFGLEGKINALVEIIRQVQPSSERMNAKNKELLGKLVETQLKL